MDKDILRKIIDAGNLAPSGSNSQPWSFIVDGDTILVRMHPEKDHPILNVGNRGTYVAHGALVENMRIAARRYGFEASVDSFPEPGISARVTFRSGAHDHGLLYDVIATRHSNRRPYRRVPLAPNEMAALLAVHAEPKCELLTIEGHAIEAAAPWLAADLPITLTNRTLHDLLFREVLWQEREQMERPGLYVKTMEITPPKSFVFRWLSSWGVAEFFNRLKLIDRIAGENTNTVASSGLIGMIVVHGTDEDFLHVGSYLERLWLTVSSLGLAMQLLTGVLFFEQGMTQGARDALTANEQAMIADAVGHLKEIFGVKDGTMAIAFRVGQAKPPTAVSLKRPPDIEWKR